MADRLLIGTRKGLFEMRRDDGSWRIADVHFLGDPVSVVAQLDDGAILAALALGHFGAKLRRLDADAKDWRELDPPAYPTKPHDSDDKTPWSVDQIMAMQPGGGDVVWAGTIPGGLFRSADRGESFSLVRPLWDRPERGDWMGGGFDHPCLHSICVDPHDARKVLIGVSCGGAWRSDDGGESWRQTAHGMYAEFMPPERRDDPNIQDPHCIVQCQGAPQVFWCQHHNGVFRSTDGGNSWSEVTAMTPSKFGFPVAVHPHDPDTAWFVPAVNDECRVPVDARLVVARTSDAGRTVEALTNGLPAGPAYDLVLRHALDVDDTGTSLAFGSTTGGLWLTENGGEKWSAFDARLPPVNCVRFAV